MQLFKEIGEWKSKAEKLTADLETLREKLAAAQTAQQASPSTVSFFTFIPLGVNLLAFLAFGVPTLVFPTK